ncbi:MAG TPA: GxxExxY protein [Candidatus Paceibacterota bacterium]
MSANDANEKIIYRDLSYKLTGLFFDVHNEIGRFEKEKKYADAIEKKLLEKNIAHKREFCIDSLGNTVDFLIEEKLILEVKAKQLIVKNDFYQTQRYLQSSQMKLGLIVNFRNRYLKPIRIIRINR